MSIHIGAKKGQIAEAVLLPGDPLRAQYLAETYLENPECYNQVRGMLGFTGAYNGKKVSVQGAGHDSPGGYRADRRTPCSGFDDPNGQRQPGHHGNCQFRVASAGLHRHDGDRPAGSHLLMFFPVKFIKLHP